MKKLGFALAGITAMLIGSQANATVCGRTMMMPAGGGSVSFSALDAGVCVQAGDKLFSIFSFGNLVANGTVAFDWEVIGGTENNNVTFTDGFVPGQMYTGFGYDVATIGSPIVALSADFTQARGGPKTSTLTATTTPTGVGSIDIVKAGPIPTPTSTYEIDYPGGVPSLMVTESLAVANNGDVTAVQNTVVQDVAEPASLGLLGVALVGFGAIRRKRKAA